MQNTIPIKFLCMYIHYCRGIPTFAFLVYPHHGLTATARGSVAQADNVGSNQMAKIRYALRGSATVLMGKNTMIRKIISTYVKENPGHPYELVRLLSLPHSQA